MKILAITGILLLLFTASSCGSKDTPNTHSRVAAKTAPDTLIAFIQSSSEPRMLFPNMLKTHWGRKFPLTLEDVRNISSRSLNNNDTIPVDSFASYRLFDHQNLKELFLFSIAYLDESGFTYLYHFTLDKKSHQLAGCTLIGESGADGGTESNSKLSYAKDGLSLIVNAKSTYEEVGTYPHELITDKSSTRYDFGKDRTTFRVLHEAHKKTVIAKEEE